MKKQLKHIFVWAMFVFILFSSLSIGSTNADSIDFNYKDDEFAIEVRKMYGLEYSDDKMIEAQNQNKYDFITPVTEEEFQVILKKEQIAIEAAELKDVLDKYEIENGNLYFDLNTGNLTVLLLDNTESARSTVKNLFKYPENIIFKEATYSYNKLFTELLRLRENSTLLVNLDVYGWGIDIRQNRIVITMNNPEDQESIAKIKEIVDEKYLIFTKGVQARISSAIANNLRTKQRPIPGGVEIQNADGLTCSAGFHGTSLAGTQVLVTAGHCKPTTTNESWYQASKGFLNTNKIGNFTHAIQTGGYADAGFIVLSDSNNSTSQIWRKVTDSESIKDSLKWIETRIGMPNSNEVIGQGVCKTGRTTGVTCGILDGIQDINVVGFGMLYDARIASTVTRDGDSGGPVWRYGGNPNNGKFELGLVGLVSATIQAPGYDGLVYSHVKYVENVLSLQSVNLN